MLLFVENHLKRDNIFTYSNYTADHKNYLNAETLFSNLDGTARKKPRNIHDKWNDGDVLFS